MGDESPGSVRLILGASQSGKSYFAKQRIEQLKASERVLVWDPNDEWRKPWAKGKKPLELDGADSVLDWFDARASGEGRDRCAFGACAHDELDVLVAYAYCATRTTLVLDEFHMACRGSSVSPTLEDMIARGRHRGVHCVFITQQPQLVPTRIYANAATVHVFRVADERGRAKLARAYGNRPEFERLASLGVGESITIDNR